MTIDLNRIEECIDLGLSLVRSETAELLALAREGEAARRHGSTAMTIDFDAIERSFLAYTVPKWSHWTELLRLARLGQQAERRKCGTCKHMVQRPSITGHMCAQQEWMRVVPDWSCADWEEKT